MLIQEHTDTPTRDVGVDRAASRPQMTVDITADLVMGYDNLLDRLLDFTYDVLGVGDLELRDRIRRAGR
jgi:hypothetical protein